MHSKTLHIIMAGMLLFSESVLMPLYSMDGNHRLNHSNCSDFVLISGTTNVNQFDFLYKRSGLTFADSDYGQLEIEIPVRDFVPSNPFMYHDFLSLLRADEYPSISISIPQNQMDFISPDNESMKPDVYITIAGITRTFKLNCSLEKCSAGVLIKGSEEIKLSDFNLKKVERLGGLVKLHDEINVSFGFIVNFTAINQVSSQR